MAPAPRPRAVARLGPDVLAAVETAACAARPREACGLLVGRMAETDYVVTRAVASANIARDPGNNFEVDPLVQLAWQKALRDSGEAVIGHYHSHPVGKPEPSLRDIAAAHDAGLLWLITAFDAQGTPVTRGYSIARDCATVRPIPLEVL